MVHNRKFQPQKFLTFLFLYTGFYCISEKLFYSGSYIMAKILIDEFVDIFFFHCSSRETRYGYPAFSTWRHLTQKLRFSYACW